MQKKTARRAQVITVNGAQIALVLDWAIHEASHRALTQHASSCGSVWGVQRPVSGQRQLSGFVSGIKARKLRQVVCGAAVIAALYDEGVFVFPVSDGRYWLVVIAQGQPVVGYDVVGNSMDIRAEIKHLLVLNAMPLFGDADFFQTAFPDLSASPVQLEDVFRTERCTADVKLTRLVRRYMRYLPGLVGVGAIVLLIAVIVPSAWFSQWVRLYQQDSMQQQWETQAQHEKNTIIQRFNAVAVNHPIDQWLGRLLSTLNKIPLEKNGWHFKTLDCAAGLSYCVISWKNSGFGTFASLDRGVASLGAMQLIDPNNVRQTIHIMDYSATHFQAEDVKKRINQLPTLQQFKLQDVSIFQQLGSITGVNFSVKSPEKNRGISQPPIDVQPTIAFPAFANGGWQLEGKGLAVLIDAVLKLNPRVFFGQALTIHIIYNEKEINSTWKLRGDYVSKI